MKVISKQEFLNHVLSIFGLSNKQDDKIYNRYSILQHTHNVLDNDDVTAMEEWLEVLNSIKGTSNEVDIIAHCIRLIKTEIALSKIGVHSLDSEHYTTIECSEDSVKRVEELYDLSLIRIKIRMKEEYFSDMVLKPYSDFVFNISKYMNVTYNVYRSLYTHAMKELKLREIPHNPKPLSLHEYTNTDTKYEQNEPCTQNSFTTAIIKKADKIKEIYNNLFDYATIRRNQMHKDFKESIKDNVFYQLNDNIANAAIEKALIEQECKEDQEQEYKTGMTKEQHREYMHDTLVRPLFEFIAEWCIFQQKDYAMYTYYVKDTFKKFKDINVPIAELDCIACTNWYTMTNVDNEAYDMYTHEVLSKVNTDIKEIGQYYFKYIK